MDTIDSEIAADSGVEGYEQFVAARSAALYRAAYVMTGSSADADDLVQVTLVKLFVGWRKARRATSVEAYARRIMVNAFVSGRRPARFRREQLVVSPPERPGPGVEQAGAEDRLTLWPQVQALPPRQRAVIVRRYLGDLSETEIADALGCAPGTVKSTASAALKTLRARMEDER